MHSSIDRADRAAALNDVAESVQTLSRVTGNATLLDEAIDTARRAVSMSPPKHPQNCELNTNLTWALLASYRRSSSVDDLHEAAQVSLRAAKLVDDSHPDYAACHYAVGIAHLELFMSSNSNEAMRQARDSLAVVMHTDMATTSQRLQACRPAIDLELRAGNCQRGLDIAEFGVTLLPQVAPRILTSQDRLRRLTTAAGMSAAAAVAATAAGQPNRAVELLELTRGIVLSDTLDTRGDIGDLRDTNPELAAEFDMLRRALDDPDQYPAGLSGRRLADRRRALDRRWNDTLNNIRNIDEFHDFLVAEDVFRLSAHARPGPIVFMVSFGQHGYALILSNSLHPVDVVELPEFAEDSVVKQVNALRTAHRAVATSKDDQVRVAGQRNIVDILSWLWDAAACPVLDRLGHSDTPKDGNPWPRVWWCPVGIAGFLPFHAAGRCEPSMNGAAVLDRVVSSYIPSVRALAHARAGRAGSHAHSTSAQPEQARTLIVSVPDAPGSAFLPGAVAETNGLLELIPSATLLPPVGWRATRDSVIAALPRHQVAHFACHGSADPSNPSRSHLVLHDHLQAPLTVRDVTRQRLDDAHLAYLSACSTSESDLDSADEFVHLTAAFHLAGYRNVIGTLWSIPDDVAIPLSVYSTLTSQGANPPETDRAAWALHLAVRAHRGRYPDAPTLWAGHTHTGV